MIIQNDNDTQHKIITETMWNKTQFFIDKLNFKKQNNFVVNIF